MGGWITMPVLIKLAKLLGNTHKHVATDLRLDRSAHLPKLEFFSYCASATGPRHYFLVNRVLAHMFQNPLVPSRPPSSLSGIEVCPVCLHTTSPLSKAVQIGRTSTLPEPSAPRTS